MEKREAERRLAELYSERGYVRVPSSDRRRAEDSQSYRKGWEARLVVETASAAREVRRWLRDAGFEAGNAYAKHSRWVVPMYGRSAVERLLKLADSSLAARTRRKKTPKRRPATPAKKGRR